MTPTEVKALTTSLSNEGKANLIETHISWVILTDEFAFKFKKPIRYSFLDYSTLSKRKFYCEREVKLNSRYSDIYLGVVPVYKRGNSVHFEANGKIRDYGVKMLKIDTDFQMDKMLKRGLVNQEHLSQLAHVIADFHLGAEIIRKPISGKELTSKFNDIDSVKDFLAGEIGPLAEQQINEAILKSDYFISNNLSLLKRRIENGFVRDLHGDLHAKNIFLGKKPVLFDCIEFNDDFRHIDVLSEIAFLCMDLEASGNGELSEAFLHRYLEIFPVMDTLEEEQLFAYYKCYRANVRAKVNALRAAQADSQTEKNRFLQDVREYMNLMVRYQREYDGQIVRSDAFYD